MTRVSGIAVAARWEFDQDGYMRRREASINDVPAGESKRRIFGPLPQAERDERFPLC
jgi:uncharacterized protein